MHLSPLLYVPSEPYNRGEPSAAPSDGLGGRDNHLRPHPIIDTQFAAGGDTHYKREGAQSIASPSLPAHLLGEVLVSAGYAQGHSMGKFEAVATL